MDTRRLTGEDITRECAICSFQTTERVFVCPHDGSALIARKPDPLIGTTLAGKFEIQSLIGSGGMGNVYKAQQRLVDRQVAIKVLHNEKLRNKDVVLRFHQEAKAAAALSHPNIVGLIDFGLTDDKIPYLVMDYLDGESLQAVLKQNTLTVNRFITIFSQVCDALQHAHSRGIIHRDIKPSNIMLCKNTEQQEVVKILDFGIAKLPPGKDNPDAMAVTQTGELFGSPQYMSPEQFAGRVLDARSDMYSLGCVMYEALTGRPPIEAESLMLLVHKHTNEQPAPLRSVKPDLDIPQQLEAVIMKTLEKEPQDRFPSMSALKHNLQFVPQFAEQERKASAQAPVKSKKTLASSPVRLAIAGAILAACTTGGAIAFLLYGVNPPGDNSLENGWLRLQMQITASCDPANKRRLLILSERLRDNCARDNLRADAVKYADQSVQFAQEIYGSAWRTAANLLRKAQIEEEIGKSSSHDTLAAAAAALATLAQSNRHNKLWSANLSVSQPIDVALIDTDSRLHGSDSPQAIMDQAAMADDMRAQNMLRAAEQVYQKIAPMHDKLSDEDKLKLSDYVLKFASACAAEGSIDAEQYYKSAIDLSSKASGAQSEMVATLTRTLGLYYKNHDQLPRAESTLMDALALAQAAQGEHGKLVTTLYDDLGEVYRAEKEFDKAAEMFKLAERLK